MDFARESIKPDDTTSELNPNLNSFDDDNSCERSLLSHKVLDIN